MSQSNDAVASWSETFKNDFERLRPWIAREWPAVDAEALTKTEGDLDGVVTLVADATKHTHTLVRMKLEELHRLSMSTSKGTTRPVDPLVELLERLEKKTTELASELRGAVLPTAREKVKENLLVSLLVALGLGFILGVIFALGGGRRER